MPSITRNLSPTERAVCWRLAAFRRFERKNQEDLAAAVGLTRDQLANIEIGRTPLKFWPGWKLCRALNMNQVYLATGQSPERPFHDFDPLEAAHVPISDSDSFDRVCTYQLAAELKFRNDMLREAIELKESGATASTYERAVLDITKAYLKLAPEAERSQVLEHLMGELHGLVQWPKAEINQGAGNNLTDTESERKPPEVKERLPSLLERLSKATRHTGKKSELAQTLGVPLASISRWLSGEREPGGEITLRLLHWVEQQERQQKSQTSDSSTGLAATRKRSSSDEKPKSSRRKP